MGRRLAMGTVESSHRGDTSGAGDASKGAMSTDPFNNDRDDLERLLDGQGGDLPSPRLQRLSDLLAAAAGPARPHELRGEEDALAAFRAAQGQSAAAAGRPHSLAAMTRSRIARIAAAVVAISAMGTTAVAMATGTVSHVVGRNHPPASSQAPAPGAPSPGGKGQGSLPFSPAMTAPGTSALAAPTSPTMPSASGTLPSDSPSVTGGSPSLTGLCREYLAISQPRRRQALKEPRFAPLISSAGGRGKVDAYCSQLLAPASPSSSSPEPSPSPSLEVSSSPGPPGSMAEPEKL